MAISPTITQTGDSLDQLLSCISQLESAGLTEDFIRYYPQHSLGVQMCRLVLEKLSTGGCNNSVGGFIDVNPSVSPAPPPLTNALSARYFVNLLSGLLENQCPNRTDPNLISCEDECLAALQQTVVECLKDVRQKRLINATSQSMQNVPQQSGGIPSSSPMSSFPGPYVVSQQRQVSVPYTQHTPVPNSFPQERLPEVHNQAPSPPPLLSCTKSCDYQQPKVLPTTTTHILPTVTDSSVLMSRALEEQLNAIPEPPPCSRRVVASDSEMLLPVTQTACNPPPASVSKQKVKFEQAMPIQQSTNEVPPVPGIPLNSSPSGNKVADWLNGLDPTNLNQVGDPENVVSSSGNQTAKCDLSAAPDMKVSKGDQCGGPGPAISLPPMVIAPNLIKPLGEIFSLSASGPTTLRFSGQINAVDGSGDNTIAKMTLNSLLSQFAPMLLRPIPSATVFTGFGRPAGCNRTFDSNRLKAWVMNVVANSSRDQCGKSQSESEENMLKYLMGLVSSWRSLYSRNARQFN